MTERDDRQAAPTALHFEPQPDPDDQPLDEVSVDTTPGWVEVELYEEVLAERDRYLRALAESENRARRASEQARIGVQRANEQFLEALLPVLAGFDRALAAGRNGATVETLLPGLELLERQLGSFLEAIGAALVAPDPGVEFDPEQHEALLRQPTTEVPDGHIAAVLEKGIALNGRIVRPARVAVASHPLDVAV
jgi:molecular chaperone GrpE